MMNLTNLSKEVHTLAIEKGWWDEERSFAEIIALIHSELSEALEEYRNGKPNVYYECKYHDTRIKCPDKFNGCQYGANEGCNIRKPEGVAVELADVIIRILDYVGKKRVSIYIENDVNLYGNVDKFSFTELITECHGFLSEAYFYADIFEEKMAYLEGCIGFIINWCKVKNIDIEEIIQLKHEYNKSRPYKHGGKVI